MPENYHVCLTDLLDQDISSYEYFHSLDNRTKRELLKMDIHTFEQLQNYTNKVQKWTNSDE